jgi:NAD(P)H-hydrate repair Nnr-like enzyme with NAD(P)H-hydrate dehydratase domain
MIASFISQGISPFEATSLATFIHGKASDEMVKEKGYRGQIASDLFDKIPGVITQYENA